ncbi:MAG: hypothetical protein KDK91_24325 [Gammaproteobacteria bacterium]|nr:hypothetical protein [Gammaproteobacteria bacterium]
MSTGNIPLLLQRYKHELERAEQRLETRLGVLRRARATLRNRLGQAAATPHGLGLAFASGLTSGLLVSTRTSGRLLGRMAISLFRLAVGAADDRLQAGSAVNEPSPTTAPPKL